MKRVFETSNLSIFHQVLESFHRAQVLDHVVIIGSWALPIYRTYFQDSHDIPIMRTMDLDFLVSRKIWMRENIDVDKLLCQLGFTPVYSQMGEYVKYLNPEMEVEFLTEELSKGDKRSIRIDSLNINAQPLRYQHFALEHTIKIHYRGYELTVPEPSVYLLLKGIIARKRPKDQTLKIEKDRYVVIELGNYLIRNEVEKKKLLTYFHMMPSPWQKDFLLTVKETAPSVLDVFTSENSTSRHN